MGRGNPFSRQVRVIQQRRSRTAYPIRKRKDPHEADRLGAQYYEEATDHDNRDRARTNRRDVDYGPQRRAY